MKIGSILTKIELDVFMANLKSMKENFVSIILEFNRTHKKTIKIPKKGLHLNYFL